jgi:hypothetical protein
MKGYGTPAILNKKNAKPANKTIPTTTVTVSVLELCIEVTNSFDGNKPKAIKIVSIKLKLHLHFV